MIWYKYEKNAITAVKFNTSNKMVKIKLGFQNWRGPTIYGQFHNTHKFSFDQFLIVI